MQPLGGISTSIWVAFFALIAAIIGPLITYIAANRKLSGKISTSEAESLWAESASMREDYRTRLDQANKRISDLEARFTESERRGNELERQNIDLVSQLTHKDQIIETLREESGEFAKQVAMLKRTIRKMLGSPDVPPEFEE